MGLGVKRDGVGRDIGNGRGMAACTVHVPCRCLMLVVLVTHAVVHAHCHTIDVSLGMLVAGDFVRAHDGGVDYVWVPDGACAGGWCRGDTRPEAGSLSFTMKCDGAAAVTFEALVLTPDTNADSFFIKIDGVMESTYWHLAINPSWDWALSSPTVEIAQGGTYRVMLQPREDGASVRALRISAGADTCLWAPWTGFVIGQVLTNSCPDGTDEITTEDMCREAASALGKTYIAAGAWATSPAGCLDESVGLSRGMFYNTHATGSAVMEQAPVCFTRFAIGQANTSSCPDGTDSITTEDMCREAATVLGKTYIAAGEWPTSPAGCLVESVNGFVTGEVLTNSCPNGTHEITTEDMCREAAIALGKPYIAAGAWATSPAGCLDESVGLSRGMFYNTHATGSAVMEQAPVCFTRSCIAGFHESNVGCAGSGTDSLQDFVGTADQCKSKCTELGDQCAAFIRIPQDAGTDEAGKCFFCSGTITETGAAADGRSCFRRCISRGVFYNTHVAGSAQTDQSPVCFPGTCNPGYLRAVNGQKEWAHCASEDEVCRCNGRVRYGDAGSNTWTAPRTVSGSISCSHAVFGDPIMGVVKTCQCEAFCKECPAGKYEDEARSGVCTDCPSGWYQDSEHSTNCKVCPGPTFSLAGDAECRNCSNLALHPPYLVATAEEWDAVNKRFTDGRHSYRHCTSELDCGTAQPHCCAGRCVCDDGCSNELSTACTVGRFCDDPADIPSVCAGGQTLGASFDRHGVLIAGNATQKKANRITVVEGTTESVIHWPNASIPSTFSLCSVTRYVGQNKVRILQCRDKNWLHGHWGDKPGSTYYATNFAAPAGSGAASDCVCPTGSVPLFGLSSAVCERMALHLGKTAGGCPSTAFTGDYSTKGCYGYSSGKYSGCFYYGTISGRDITSESQLTAVSGGQYRPVQVTGSDAASDCICDAGFTSAGIGANSTEITSSDTDWVVACGRNIATAGAVSTIGNKITMSTAGAGYGDCALSINSPTHGWGFGGSEWQLSRLYVWDYHLPDDVFVKISTELFDWVHGNSTCLCPRGYACTYEMWPKEQCDQGTYSPHGANTCNVCVGGKYSLAGAHFCANCPRGKHQSSTRSSACYDCTAGEFQPAKGATHCLACGAGTFSASGATICSLCGAGTFSASGAATCAVCGNNSYSAAGSETCACNVGYGGSAPSLVPNAGNCTSCGAGKHKNVTGPASCQDCIAGKYSSAPGAAECSGCVVGKFSATNGSQSCEACGNNSHSPAGSDSCACNVGYTGPNCSTTTATDMTSSSTTSLPTSTAVSYGTTSSFAASTSTPAPTPQGSTSTSTTMTSSSATSLPTSTAVLYGTTSSFDSAESTTAFSTAAPMTTGINVGASSASTISTSATMPESSTTTTIAPTSTPSVTTTALATTTTITTTNVTTTISLPVLTTPTPIFVSCGIKCRMKIVEWKCNTTCGDGFRAGVEECDDGNDADGDGCRCENRV